VVLRVKLSIGLNCGVSVPSVIGKLILTGLDRVYVYCYLEGMGVEIQRL